MNVREFTEAMGQASGEYGKIVDEAASELIRKQRQITREFLGEPLPDDIREAAEDVPPRRERR